MRRVIDFQVPSITGSLCPDCRGVIIFFFFFFFYPGKRMVSYIFNGILKMLLSLPASPPPPPFVSLSHTHTHTHSLSPTLFLTHLFFPFFHPLSLSSCMIRCLRASNKAVQCAPIPTSPLFFRDSPQRLDYYCLIECGCPPYGWN